RHGITLPDRRGKALIVDCLHMGGASPADLLRDLPRDRLQEGCRGPGLHASGREKAAIVERIIGVSGGAAPGPAAAPASAPPPSPRKPRAAETKNGGDLGFERTLFLAADQL